MHYLKIINTLKKKTDTVILFHSGTGKDSIMLADICSKNFKKVYCVFMYLVKDLEYENRYINWTKKKYPNIEFIQTPHYAIYSFIKYGYLGIKKDTLQSKTTISKIDEKIRKKININWSIYGLKKIDGITRRLMLNSTENGIMYKTQKAYPLMDLKNSDVLNYIKENNLITPFNYGTLKPSSGCDISTPEFLYYLEQKYPKDLKKVIAQFPHTEIKLFNHKNYTLNETI